MTQPGSPDAADGGMSLLDFVLVLAKNIRTLVVAPTLAALVALGITFIISPTYVATARILPPQQQQSTLANMLANQLGGMTSALTGIKNPADIYVAMLKSRTTADALLARFDLRRAFDTKYDEDARSELARRTQVIAGKDGLITIEVEDHNAPRAAEIANGYVDALHDLTQRLAVTEAGQRRLFFERQLKQAKDELTNAEIALRASGISAASLKTVPRSALDELAHLKAQVTAQEVRVGAMRGYMTDANPEFRRAQQELIALRAQLAKVEQADQGKASTAGAEYIAKFRDFKYYETLFDLIAKEYEAARLDEAREGAVIQVVDNAVAPERPSKPRRLLVSSLVACATLMISTIIIFLGESLRNPADALKLRQIREALSRRMR